MKCKYSFEEKKKYIGIAAACILIIIAGIIYVCNRRSGNDGNSDASVVYSEVIAASNDESTACDTEAGNKDDSIDVQSPDSIYVHVCGAVNKPGLYEVAPESRIADVIDVAGGFTDKAARNYLNLATLVNDGQKIVVPTKTDVKNGNVADSGSDMESGQDGLAKESYGKKVNINTAGIEELMTIPGVGEAKAKSIIEYRQTNGNYTCKEDIMNITGIKEGVFSKMSDYIVVN